MGPFWTRLCTEKDRFGHFLSWPDSVISYNQNGFNWATFGNDII
jgi:hypothetical protein